ncbi:hypothetical protein VNO77_27851 [Canavalia gladiata]|uniref:Uncharacterized protein n=1 Tax=Canavalia gladiata TaxID=3824 RepID=A0AAN9QAW3_CANGL
MLEWKKKKKNYRIEDSECDPFIRERDGLACARLMAISLMLTSHGRLTLIRLKLGMPHHNPKGGGDKDEKGGKRKGK